MNDAALKIALEALRSGKFQAEFEAELRAKREARAAFVKSDTFTRMLEAFKGQSKHISISTEDVSYFADDVRKNAGWEFATDVDLDRFFDIVGDSSAETVEPGSVQEDPECAFDNEEFRHFGLSVRRLSGQGTIITIHNR